MEEEISKSCAEKLFKEFSNSVYRLALVLTKSKELADDITQDTFIQVFRKYYTYDSSKPIHPWIYKITLNITRNMLRKQKWLKFFNRLPERGNYNLVENAVWKSEEEKLLWTEINRLGVKSREVIILHFYFGLKLQEVADSMGIPLGTCKSRLNYALNTLRKNLPQNEFSFLKNGGELYETT
ncbi:RNA polymerase sigma factor [Phosphitispora fastidiosa]|uniref:RNA polymerase sigma factor n=1 Tax=Phosphitispora fastidiosa TaxID=2837202 RepID=UPI001E3902E1|nr:sigma-70 family RNA polymerase sigma factor [Phosphitispora fastidiosa]MBU7005891.1 RNA polymerase sigma-70 factor (ECF subfamily) [Phosphitispora fastidiosa]